MDTIESLKTITALIDGLTTIGFAVWFITMLSREIDQQRAQNKELIDGITKQNEQLINLMRDDLHNMRFSGVYRAVGPEFTNKTGLD